MFWWKLKITFINTTGRKEGRHLTGDVVFLYEEKFLVTLLESQCFSLLLCHCVGGFENAELTHLHGTDKKTPRQQSLKEITYQK